MGWLNKGSMLLLALLLFGNLGCGNKQLEELASKAQQGIDHARQCRNRRSDECHRHRPTAGRFDLRVVESERRILQFDDRCVDGGESGRRWQCDAHHHRHRSHGRCEDEYCRSNGF